MSVRFGHTELPERQSRALARAKSLEQISLIVIAATVVAVFLVSGNSQAMKAAWVEDSLSLLPPLSFLIAARFIRRTPTPKYPYGYHRSVGIAHLVSSTALLAMGLYLLIDSGGGLFQAEHPPIGVMVIFDTPVWQGWLMIAVMVAVGVPPVILGHLKMRLAPVLHDKVLYADALMNKADWMTSLATVVGVLGVGIGWWWADSAAAIIVAVDILRDGYSNLRGVIRDLMDARATQTDGSDPDPVTDAIKAELDQVAWVAERECRVRDQGHLLHVEAFVVPASGVLPDLKEITRIREKCMTIDWRVHDFVLCVVEELPYELLPQIDVPPQDEDSR